MLDLKLPLGKLPKVEVEEGRPDAQPHTPIGEVLARITGDPSAEEALRANYAAARKAWSALESTSAPAASSMYSPAT